MVSLERHLQSAFVPTPTLSILPDPSFCKALPHDTAMVFWFTDWLYGNTKAGSKVFINSAKFQVVIIEKKYMNLLIHIFISILPYVLRYVSFIFNLEVF